MVPTGRSQWYNRIDVITDTTGNSYVIGENSYRNKATFGNIVSSRSPHFIAKPSGDVSSISGRLFKDLDGGALNAGEPPVPNVVIRLQPGTSYLKSDSSGDDNWFEYVGSTSNAPSTNGNELPWPYADLAPGRSTMVSLKLPVSVALGTVVQVKASIDPVSNDRAPDDNAELLPVRCGCFPIRLRIS